MTEERKEHFQLWYVLDHLGFKKHLGFELQDK